MAIIQNAELWYCKLDPSRPNKSLNKNQPTWEVQIRTKDKAVKKLWEEMDLNVKVVDDDKEGIFYRVNLKKKAFKDGGAEDAKPVRVVDGKLNDIDPKSIGNGSIGHVRVFQHPYEFNGTKGIASVLMAIQLVKHLVYVPKPFDDEFEETETETIIPPPVEEGAATGPGGKPAEAF